MTKIKNESHYYLLLQTLKQWSDLLINCTFSKLKKWRLSFKMDIKSILWRKCWKDLADRFLYTCCPQVSCCFSYVVNLLIETDERFMNLCPVWCRVGCVCKVKNLNEKTQQQQQQPWPLAVSLWPKQTAVEELAAPFTYVSLIKGACYRKAPFMQLEWKLPF